jgi:hypothetical protein
MGDETVGRTQVDSYSDLTIAMNLSRGAWLGNLQQHHRQ